MDPISIFAVFSLCVSLLCIFFYLLHRIISSRGRIRRRRQPHECRLLPVTNKIGSSRPRTQNGLTLTATVSEEHIYDTFVAPLSNITKIEELPDYLIQAVDSSSGQSRLQTQFKNVQEFCNLKPPEDEYLTIVERNSRQILFRSDSNDKSGPRFINGYQTPQAFIVTNSPRKRTVNDFWQLIWRERVNTIVMLTHIVQDGEIKCMKYWPKLKHTFGQIEIENVKTEDCPSFKKRIFQIENHKITHYQFTAWPEDHRNMEHLIHLILELSNIQQTRPIVIHGHEDDRVGTLIFCDIALRMGLKENQIDFVGIFYELGQQKASLLGSNSYQYILGHLMVLDCLYEKKFAVPVCPQFQGIVENFLRKPTVKPLMEAVDHSFAFYQKIIDSEIYLNPRGGLDPDFLPVDSCVSSRKFVVTKQPTFDNVDSFWKFVNRSDISTIISLNELDPTDSTNFEFWKWEIVNQGSEDEVCLPIFEETDRGAFRKLKINTSYKGHNKQVALFNLKTWKRGAYKPQNVLELIIIWKDLLRAQEEGDGGLVLLTCLNGHRASGLFIAMCIMLEKLYSDRTCDVYSAVRIVRRFNPQFVQEWSQFEFLYKAAAEYSKRYSIY